MSCTRCVTTKDGLGEHHAPDCPEMFWPDGRRRGVLVDPDPLPALIEDPERRARYQFSNPGGESPIGQEMAEIFGGLTERMIARHIAAARRAHLEDAS